MNLTSLNRMLAYYGDRDTNVLTDNNTNRRELINWITSTSVKIENYLDRKIEKASRTEYFDITHNRLQYYPDAYPIDSITSVKVTSDGLFDGSETTLDTDEYYTGVASGTLCLVWSERYEAYRGLQMVYTGGLATHPVNSTFNVSNGDSFTAGNYVQGGTSLAVGEVVSGAASALVVENYYGIFSASETLTEYSTYTEAAGPTSATAVTGTISSITSQSLAEAYPDITRACEMEIRYLFAHKHDFENQTTTPDGESRRRDDSKYSLQPEVRAILDPYKRMNFV